MPGEIVPIRYPKVPLWRRSTALLIDLFVVGLLSLIMGTGAIARSFIFILAWLCLRVVLVSKNHGQSLGRWALDMKVIDAKRGGTPGLKELTQREIIVGLGALLTLLGLVNLGPTAPWALFLLMPLAADCGFAYLDQEKQQAWHDQLSGTLVVQTRRGYSLDIKVRRLLAYTQRRMK
jgi:uncharacterized RDD family membrane protein YckC